MISRRGFLCGMVKAEEKRPKFNLIRSLWEKYAA